tara:strand:- start:3111 stop:3530 length:420 start_codon:yes stop_codon:yes gene_type:complete
MLCDQDDHISTLFYGIALALAVVFLMIAFRNLTPPKPPPATGDAMAPPPPPPPPASLMKNLIDAGATFYGASWCGFTKKQLAELHITETSTNGLDYVDCEAQEKLCQEKGVEAFPTWQINGQMYPGYFPPAKLQEMLQK